MVYVDYSIVAKPYALLERCVFGGKLQAARVAHLDKLVNELGSELAPRVLVVGDGDGRFLQALLMRVADVQVDYVDCSPGMLKVAKLRVANDSRVHWHCCTFEGFDGAGYTAVISHFLLDRYDQVGRDSMIKRFACKIETGGFLLVSDFDPVAEGAKLWMLKLMQYFFFLSARSPIVNVAKGDASFARAGAVILDEKHWDDGWIYSQIWKMS